MEFLNSFRVNLNEFHFQKVKEIDDFDYSKTLKKVNHELGGVSNEYLQKGLLNLKKYYAVALLDPKNEHAVSFNVDPFWHSHILHTKEYVEFTNSVFNQFIHHEPLDKDNLNELTKVSELYEYTINVYSKIFKDTDNVWWPKLNGIDPNGPVVCRHMMINDENIVKMSLFDKRKGKIPVSSSLTNSN